MYCRFYQTTYSLMYCMLLTGGGGMALSDDTGFKGVLKKMSSGVGCHHSTA